MLATSMPGLGDYAAVIGGLGAIAGLCTGLVAAAALYAIHRRRRPLRWYVRRVLLAAGLPVAFAALVLGALVIALLT